MAPRAPAPGPGPEGEGSRPGEWGPDVADVQEGEYDVRPPTMEEVEKALFRLKTNKAAGPDGCEAELYKILDEQKRKAVLSTTRHIWESEEWDATCSKARVASIYKKGIQRSRKTIARSHCSPYCTN